MSSVEKIGDMTSAKGSPQFVERLRRGNQLARLTVSSIPDGGWEVRAETDSRVVWKRRYVDWHRVERARALHRSDLTSSGWQEEG